MRKRIIAIAVSVKGWFTLTDANRERHCNKSIPSIFRLLSKLTRQFVYSFIKNFHYFVLSASKGKYLLVILLCFRTLSKEFHLDLVPIYRFNSFINVLHRFIDQDGRVSTCIYKDYSQKRHRNGS